ncbi:Hypothetical predicted protein [Octopus vulgaris]|uniref:Uncharacterized protein n=1 Tax=Octopus vulgaris TaxID=6645 RepID=A0AA36B8L1_OCTVU|nr:Hypothetical predicted protein [Octopus vulgaris]
MNKDTLKENELLTSMNVRKPCDCGVGGAVDVDVGVGDDGDGRIEDVVEGVVDVVVVVVVGGGGGGAGVGGSDGISIHRKS